MAVVYETKRLVVRELDDGDADALYDLHSRDEVMRWLDRKISQGPDDEIARMARWRERSRDGLGIWGIAERDTGRVVGAQVLIPFDDLPYVDLGWRLHPDVWGRGYATESACGAVAYGFDVLGLDEIAAVTLPHNVRSRAVMERLGMTYAGDVVHADLPHVLYLLRA
jgi:ribosomal-protein-alanine N-acetyltransferase